MQGQNPLWSCITSSVQSLLAPMLTRLKGGSHPSCLFISLSIIKFYLKIKFVTFNMDIMMMQNLIKSQSEIISQAN